MGQTIEKNSERYGCEEEGSYLYAMLLYGQC
jgi:hypothetical protein